MEVLQLHYIQLHLKPGEMHYYVSAGFLSKHEYSAGDQGGLFFSRASLASQGSPLASTVRNGIINQPLEEVWVEFTGILIQKQSSTATRG
jgi:hypothetical protein